MIKRIGILTSGGDAPGMNAAIRSVVRSASSHGVEVLGIRRGYTGLINNDMIELHNKGVGPLMNRGGTFLFTARSEEFMTPEGRKKAYENYKARGLDALVAIGGDGTFRGLKDLTDEYPVNVVGIPATIDNDVGSTHYTIGYDTAANTAVEAIDKIKDTMQSHERCSVIEVMGRSSGKLALYVAIATGATTVLVPEEKWNFKEDIQDKIRNYRDAGYNHYIIIVAEGAVNNDEGLKIKGSVGQTVKDLIKERTHLDPRLTVLGHIQRGGTPGVRDRVTATRMGCLAVHAILEGRKNRIIIHRDGRIDDIDIKDAVKQKTRLYKLERIIIEEMTGKVKG